MNEEVLFWLKQAESDLRKAKILAEKKEFDGTTFYCQQTAEKALKAVSLFNGRGLTKTHDLSILGRLVTLPKELLTKAILLNPFYTSSRYPLLMGSNIPDEETSNESMAHAEEILKWCKQQIPT
jgi:HEPN domain-containing protein